jgi:hypothetical protein
LTRAAFCAACLHDLLARLGQIKKIRAGRQQVR